MAQIGCDADRQRDEHADAHSGKHIGWPMDTQHQSRSRNQRDPQHGEQHSEVSPAWPKPGNTQSGSGGKGRCIERMTTREAGSPVPLGLPRIGNSTA